MSFNKFHVTLKKKTTECYNSAKGPLATTGHWRLVVERDDTKVAGGPSDSKKKPTSETVYDLENIESTGCVLS